MTFFETGTAMSADTKEPKILYTQLVCRQTGEILGHETGPSGLTNYCAKHLWDVRFGQEIIVTDTSEVVHPFKFLRPIAKNTTIKIYADTHDDVQPLGVAPIWSGLAIKLDQSGMSIEDIAGNTWSAFTGSGEWVGTSEY
ncbi:hypothetical protein [Pseudovibrio sp. POLY-S9]|uniref:hypothetical protein n=1 Tax=Pseudovibrio sp. POLY-S9 TaxID=1576596 RepID=UPI000710F6C6|nr:hypothetical protein [Pseudovibrio sp. POLY-S9]